MADKKSFALRIDAVMMKAIEKWAADEFRSVNGQIEWILHNALKEAARLKEKPLRKKTKNPSNMTLGFLLLYLGNIIPNLRFKCTYS